MKGHARAPRYAAVPLDLLLTRSASAFNSVIYDRRRRGDAPAEPAKLFMRGQSRFGLVEWPDGRWLVLPLAPRRRRVA